MNSVHLTVRHFLQRREEQEREQEETDLHLHLHLQQVKQGWSSQAEERTGHLKSRGREPEGSGWGVKSMMGDERQKNQERDQSINQLYLYSPLQHTHTHGGQSAFH